MAKFVAYKAISVIPGRVFVEGADTIEIYCQQKLEFISNAQKHAAYENCRFVSDMNLEILEVLLFYRMIPVCTSP